jgi:hypothetical protein
MRLTAFVTLVLLLSSIARAATFNVTPSADAFVSSANPANNYGGAGAITVSAPGLPKGELQSLLQFNLAAAKTSFDARFGAGQWLLSSASLQLTAASPNNGIFNSPAAGQIAAAWQQNDAWTEGAGTPSGPTSSGVTWNSLASLTLAGDQALGTFNYNGSTSGAVTMPLAISSGLAGDAAAGGLLSLRLFAPSGETAVTGVFNSRSFTQALSRPMLALTAIAVPEPASSACICAAIALSMAARRRA